MASINFEGTGVALVTPLTSDLQVDFNGLARLLEHTSSLDFWVVNGTTGESPTITVSERQEILKFIHKHNPHNKPIMYGVGGNNTQRVLHMIEKIDFAQIQGILSVCPYYNKPTQEGLYQHYNAIADAAPVPVMLYNVPGRTSVNIEAQTTLRLAEHPNIMGIKEATNDYQQIKAIGSQKPNDFLLTAGNDDTTIDIIRNGGCGVISVLANALPDQMSQMVAYSRTGQWEQAQQVLKALLPVNPLMYKESNPVGIKKLLEHMGICTAKVRLPLVEASAALSLELQQYLQHQTVNKA